MKRFTPILLLVFISFAASAQLTFNWSSQTIHEGYNMKAMNLVNDTTSILVGYGHTFEVSKDQGSTWNHVPILDPVYDFGVMSINASGLGYAGTGDERLIDNPSSSSEIDVYTDGVLLHTSDDGASWEQVEVSSLVGTDTDPGLNPFMDDCYGRHFYAIEVLDDGTIFMGMQWYSYESAASPKVTYATVVKSTDGINWTSITDNNKYPYGIAAGTSTVLIGGLNHLLKASADNETVTDIYANLVTANSDDASIFINDFYVVSEDEIYVISSGDGIFLTTDQGATFTELGSGAPTGGNDMIMIDANTTLVLGSSSKSKLTTDAGATWIDFYPGGICYEIGGILNDTLVALAKSDIYKIALTDLKAGTNTWFTQTLSSNNNLQKMHIIDANNAIIAGFGTTMTYTNDAGLIWTQAELGDLWTAAAPQYDFSSVSTVGETSYACTRRAYVIDFPSSSSRSDVYGSGLIVKSDDYWETWTTLDPANIGTGTDPASNPNVEGCYGISPTEIANINDSVALAYITYLDTTAGIDNKAYHSHVYRTDDSGDSWLPVTDDFGSSYINDIDFIDENEGYIVGNNIFMKTVDKGLTFTDVYPSLTACPDAPADGNIYIAAFEYIDQNEWYIASISDGVYATYDAGVNYTKLGSIGGGNGLYKHNDSTYAVLGAKTKTKISWDYGANWTDFNVGESIWSLGGALNDSLIGLAKGKIYKIALVDLNAPQTGADILSFVFANQTEASVIDSDAHTVNINLSTGTDITNLTPTITISDKATISPAIDAAQDFSSAIVYTVKSEDLKTTNAWTVTVTVGVNVNDDLAMNIMIYPNPAKDVLFLNNIASVDKVSIMSITGSTVLTMDNASDRAEINISELKNGIYIISLLDEDGSMNIERFVKK